MNDADHNVANSAVELLRAPEEALNGILDDRWLAACFVWLAQNRGRKLLAILSIESVRLRYLGVHGFLLVTEPEHPAVDLFVRLLLDQPAKVGAPYLNSWVVHRSTAMRVEQLLQHPGKNALLHALETVAGEGQKESMALLHHIEQKGTPWERFRARASLRTAEARLRAARTQNLQPAYPDLIPVQDFRTHDKHRTTDTADEPAGRLTLSDR